MEWAFVISLPQQPMKHKILILSTVVPYPPDRGHRIRLYYLIRQLLTSFKVGVITMAFTDEEYDNAEKLRNHLPDIDPLIVVRSPAHENPVARIRGFCSSLLHALPGRPREVYYHTQKQLRRAFDEAYRSFDPHLVQCVYWFTLGAIDTLVTAEVWIDSIDLHWRRARTSLKNNSKRQLSMLDRLRTHIIRRNEIAAYENVDRVLAIQETEAEILSSVISTPVSTLPISCPIPERPLSRNPEPVICFIGPMDYHPNRDAVRFLVDSVMPRIRAQVPESRLIVIGRKTESRSLPHDEWMEYTGHVDDLDSVLQTAAVGVAPVRFGSGVNVKVITMLSRGLPVVATGTAVEGLPLRDGIDFVRAEDADSFAESIVELLSNPSRGEAIGMSGHSVVRSSFSWETNAPEVVRLYRKWLKCKYSSHS